MNKNCNDLYLDDPFGLGVDKKNFEKDPSGKDQHVPGAKLDAGKLRPYLVHAGFVKALQEVWKAGTYGATKYSPNGWKEVEGAFNRYMDAHGRHLEKYMLGEIYDPETKAHHLGAAAWNLLAALHFDLIKRDE